MPLASNSSALASGRETCVKAVAPLAAAVAFLGACSSLAIIGAVVWYYPRPENQPKTGGRSQFGGPVPVGVATVQKGNMPVTLTGWHGDAARHGVKAVAPLAAAVAFLGAARSGDHRRGSLVLPEA